MINLSLKHSGVSFARANSYQKSFKLAHINWELNRQEDRLFTLPVKDKRSTLNQTGR